MYRYVALSYMSIVLWLGCQSWTIGLYIHDFILIPADLWLGCQSWTLGISFTLFLINFNFIPADLWLGCQSWTLGISFGLLVTNFIYIETWFGCQKLKWVKHFLLNKWFIIKQPGDGWVILSMILDINLKKLLSPSYLENLQIFEMKNLEYKQQKFVRNFERNFRKDWSSHYGQGSISNI